ncbi:MAG: DegV family protein [Candidatus Coproplasma sp.]
MIKIITDGAADISLEAAKELGMRVIPIKVNFNGDEYIPLENLSNEQFYSMLKEAKQLPTTSLINEITYKEVIEEELSLGNQVFVMALSSNLSGSYAALERAVAEINSPNVAICDTRLATVCQQILVREAVKIARSGASLSELKNKVDALKQKARLIAIVNDVTNLVKGGRLSGAAGFAASVLKIKPVVVLQDGLVKAVSKSVGVRHATETIVKMIKNVDADREMCFGHSDCLDRLSVFIAAVKSKTAINTDAVYELGAVIGTHAGQGCVGVAYFEK